MKLESTKIQSFFAISDGISLMNMLCGFMRENAGAFDFYASAYPQLRQQYSNKQNPITSSEVMGLLFNLVELTGLEPVTPSMSTRYSNQLSYSSATMLF